MRIYPYIECPRENYSMDPLEGCRECTGVGYHHSIENPEFNFDKQTKIGNSASEERGRAQSETFKRIYGTNNGEVCDTYNGPCACGAWH